MTRQELQDALEELHPDVENIKEFSKQSGDYWNSEIKVFFDFPPDGVKRAYTITKVTSEGIMIKNHTVDRPVGHE